LFKDNIYLDVLLSHESEMPAIALHRYASIFLLKMKTLQYRKFSKQEGGFSENVVREDTNHGWGIEAQ